MDEADDRRIGLGSKEGAQGFANLAVDELGRPVLVDHVVLELALGEEAQRLSGLRRSVGDLDDPNEFLLDRHGRMAVVEASVTEDRARGDDGDAGDAPLPIPSAAGLDVTREALRIFADDLTDESAARLRSVVDASDGYEWGGLA